MTERILIGSAEIDGSIITAGVYDANMKNLRYIRGDVSDGIPEGMTVGDFLYRIYENSTGSLLTHDFKMNGE